jgi:predicted AAA+ superfamily ATPase
MILKEILKQVIISQKENITSKEQGIEREKLKEIILDSNHAIIISGIRRCGKSTLLLQIMKKVKKYHYLNFEDSRIVEFRAEDFERLDKAFEEINGKAQYYFFDEIQNVAHWEIFIRTLLDQGKKVFITGSNASMLSKELGTRLTGRHMSYELYPFSYNEYLILRNNVKEKKSFDKYIEEGGFPEFLTTKNSAILQQLLQDILVRDVIVRHKIRNTKTIKELTKYLLSNIGKEFSYNNIKNILNEKSAKSIIKFITYLEDSYILFTIPQFSYSIKKQLVRPKKIYAIDPRMITENSVTLSENKGTMLENIIFLQLKRHGKEIYYYKEKGECDFIIKEKNNITEAIQVCHELNEENKEREINGLTHAIKEFKLREGTIITSEQEDELKIEGKIIKVIPAWNWISNY